MPNLGEIFPNFQADTTIGTIDFHGYVDKSWVVLFSHPADYTPVCTTELSEIVKLMPEFKKRNVKVIGLSCNSVSSHNGWAKDVMAYGNDKGDLPYPIIADEKRELAVKLGMIDPDEIDAQGLPLTARAVFVVGPDKKLKLSFLYPATTGRNYDELLRAIDSLQLTAKHKVATPVNWKAGGDCMILPTVSDKEAAKLFPHINEVKLPSGKHYLRYTHHPTD